MWTKTQDVNKIILKFHLARPIGTHVSFFKKKTYVLDVFL